MTVNSKTTISEGGKLANTNRQTAIKESKMKITTPTAHAVWQACLPCWQGYASSSLECSIP